MLIGLDLDNTIIDYDAAFARAAARAGLVPPDFAGSKRDVRARLWALPDGDRAWRRLQAQVYGPNIGEAVLGEGYFTFAELAARAGADLAIISHKTRFAAAAPEGTDLRVRALDWLIANKVTGPARGQVPLDRVVFTDTRDAKIDAIGRMSCAVFVDDLTEILLHPKFPAMTARLHYHPDADDATLVRSGLVTCRSWGDVARFTLGA
jgi:hypothetical protein